MASNRKSTPSEIAAAKLENEKAMNKARKAMPGYKSNLKDARERLWDTPLKFYTTDKMDAQKMVDKAASTGGNFGNLSAKKEATLGRAKKQALKNKLKKTPKATNAPYGNPNE